MPRWRRRPRARRRGRRAARRPARERSSKRDKGRRPSASTDRGSRDPGVALSDAGGVPGRRASGSCRVPARRLPVLPAHARPDRAAFAERGWQTVVGFQTRNPIHRAHEYIQKCALEIVDGLLVHPLVGADEGRRRPADVRMGATRRCSRATTRRTARWSACSRPRCATPVRARRSCTRSAARTTAARISSSVATTPASAGYYGTYDAQQIFSEFAPGELGIQPLNFEHSFWCNRCEGMASPKTCPHGEENRVSLSGTRCATCSRGERPPQEFSRPEVADILIAAMQAQVGEVDTGYVSQLIRISISSQRGGRCGDASAWLGGGLEFSQRELARGAGVASGHDLSYL